MVRFLDLPFSFPPSSVARMATYVQACSLPIARRGFPSGANLPGSIRFGRSMLHLYVFRDRNDLGFL